MVFEGNYFDQSHFINDFKSIIGEKSPGDFFNRNLTVVKMFAANWKGRSDNLSFFPITPLFAGLSFHSFEIQYQY
jgi:hypothetical protein